jgi:hypothetical protein
MYNLKDLVRSLVMLEDVVDNMDDSITTSVKQQLNSRIDDIALILKSFKQTT